MMLYIEMVNTAFRELLAVLANSAPVVLVLTAGAWAVLSSAKGTTARTRHLMWWAVLGACLAFPLLRLVPVSEMFAHAESQRVVAAQLTPAVETASAPAPAQQPVPLASESVRRPLEVEAGFLPLFLAILWAAVCVVQLLRIGYSYLYLRKLKRQATPAPRQLRLEFDKWVLSCQVDRDVRLLLSDSVTSPIAIGFHHPAVIIPTSLPALLTPTELEHVLLHELAHLARRDDWTNLVARLSSALVAFHPIALWILRRIDSEREVACDDWVVSATGAARSYAATLARLFEFRLAQQRQMLATGIGGRRSRFSDRIERLLEARSRETQSSTRRVAALLALLILLAVAGTRTPEWVVLAQTEPPAPPAAVPAPAPPPAKPAAATRVPQAPRTPEPPAPPAMAVHEDIAVLAPPPHPAMTPHHPFALQPAAPSSPSQPARTENGESFLKALADAGYSNLSVEELIELKVHGVTAPWIRAIRQSGWKLTTKEMVDLRVHGVTPEYVRDIHALGFGPYSSKQFVDFAVHGTTAEFFRALKETGFASAQPKEIVNARVHGIKASDLKEAKKYGNLSLDQIVRLKLAGVL